MLVRGLLLGALWIGLGYVLVDVFWLTPERLGSVRWNKRSLHAARRDQAQGNGSRRRVWFWRARLYLASRARKNL